PRRTPAGADGRCGRRVRRGTVPVVCRATVEAVTHVAAPRYLRIGTWLAVPVHLRATIYVVIAALCVAGVGVATLSMGDLGIPPGQIVHAITGTAEGPTAFVFERLRGPRLVVAIGAGAALAVAGGLFQTV